MTPKGLASAPAILKPGAHRWPIKTGTDPEARAVVTAPLSTSIAALRALPAPTILPGTRLPPVELTVYTIQATLIGHKEEADGDYHLVLQDANGLTMIAEVPDPAFVGPSSPFLHQITEARKAFAARIPVIWPSLRRCSLPIQVTGAGFFDTCHGQDGVAPNGVELHPVLGVTFE